MPSIFAQVLKQLLEATDFYNRNDWSRFLGISESALSQWLNDRTVPRADLLRMVIDLLNVRGGEAAIGPLAALEAIMDKPSETISPIGARFAPNLRSYLKPRSLTQFGRALREMPVAEQLAMLRDGGSGAPSEAANRPPVDAQQRPPIELNELSIVETNGLGPAWRVPRLVHVERSHGIERQVSLEEFAALPRVALVGAAGSGKTAFLSFLQSKVPGWQTSHRLNLRNLSAAAVGEWLDRRTGGDAVSPLVVDGLDEMAMDHREESIEIINRVAQDVPTARMLVATRPVSGLERLSAFDNLEIAPLSDIDVVAEVTRSALACKSPTEVDRFLCHLTERESLKPALRNPLFLQTAWSLFEQSGVTPFADGMIVRECARRLLERDHSKGFSRVREPWATSQVLFPLLGEVSFHLLCGQEDAFDEATLAKWIDETSWKLPTGKLLDLLLVQGILSEIDQRYCFSHRILRDFFAALYVIGSAASAAEYLKAVPSDPELRGVMRIACSLATDATPLLKTVVGTQGSHGTNFTLLADVLAQPIAVRPRALSDSCRMLVSWLDDQTSEWEVIDDASTLSDQQARWLVCAQVGRPKDSSAIAWILRAIHRARSGPAYEPFKMHLSEARSPFLPRFSEALDVEGNLKVNFGSEHASPGGARVAVEGLQLA